MTNESRSDIGHADDDPASYDHIDYFSDPGVIAEPFAYWDYFRERCPVRHEPKHGVAMITGYDEVMSVYHDTATWSSCNTVSGPFYSFSVPLEGDDITQIIEQHRHELPFNTELPAMDPPMHTEQRGLLLRLITPKRLNENEAFMWRIADRQIATIADRPGCEFVAEFAQPFTLYVVADLLGVPDEDREEFRAEFEENRLSRYNRQSTDIEHDQLAYLHRRFFRYVEDRRREPRDDVLTGLATATFPDGRLPEVHEIVRIAANLFTAGQETTVRLLAAALKIIAEHRELQQQLRDSKELIPNFIEETLRVETPIKSVFRLSRVPTTVGGVDLPAGTTAALIVGAANRDQRQFECPAEFRPDRPNARQHIAFGHGIHTCAGAPLARSEARIAIERLLDTFSEIRVSEAQHGPPEARRFNYLPTHLLRALSALHLEYSRA